MTPTLERGQLWKDAEGDTILIVYDSKEDALNAVLLRWADTTDEDSHSHLCGFDTEKLEEHLEEGATYLGSI